MMGGAAYSVLWWIQLQLELPWEQLAGMLHSRVQEGESQQPSCTVAWWLQGFLVAHALLQGVCICVHSV